MTDDAVALLRQKKFVEGKRNSLYLSFKIVESSKHIGLKASYIKNKSFNDAYYKKAHRRLPLEILALLQELIWMNSYWTNCQTCLMRHKNIIR